MEESRAHTPIDASFLLGGSRVSQLPPSEFPEVAVFGRSNVGKSTFINRLANRRNIARASRTPGRTREVNLFKVVFSASKTAPKAYVLADLPGYGFAKVSKSEARAIATLIEDYITERPDIACGCLLIDIRRDPREEEFLVRQEFFERGAPLIVVLTKSDKLSKNEQKKRAALIAKALQLEATDLVLSGEGMPIAPVWERIMLAVGQ